MSKYKETKIVLPIFWLVNILIFRKHNYHNLYKNFSHVKSAHGQCWSTTGHDAMLDDMLTTSHKSLNFFYISFDFEVWYSFACNFPFVDYASKLVFVHTVFQCCRFKLYSYFRHEAPCGIWKLTAAFVSKIGVFSIATFRCQNGRISTSGSPNLTISKKSRYSNPVDDSGLLVSMRHRPSPCKGKEPMTRYSKSHSHTILKAKQGRVRCRWEAHNI